MARPNRSNPAAAPYFFMDTQESITSCIAGW
jgi:hypothetical protein